MHNLDGQVILVTGATDGLGRQLAERAAENSATVVLHGRRRERLERAINEIRTATGNVRLSYHLADLASLSQVRQLAGDIRQRHDRLDVLVNNAGVGGGPRGPHTRELSEDGYELRFAVNYLAHYLLTFELLPLIHRSAPARIVNVASIGQEPIDFDDVMMERDYDPFRAYRQSKLAQIMFTFDLAERLPADEVTVNALHPATLMNTTMVSEWFGDAMSTVEEGLDAIWNLVAAPDLAGVTGRYFEGEHEARAKGQAYDADARARLRELSDSLIQ